MAANNDVSAVLSARIRYRAAIRGLHDGQSDEETIIKRVLQAFITDDPESTFRHNPQLSFEHRKEIDAILWCGQTQLGKTHDMLLAAWIGHFVYDVFPVIFVKQSGGINAKKDLRADIDDFNVKIVKALKPFLSTFSRKKYFLRAIDDMCEVERDDFRNGSAYVLLRLAGAHDLARVTANEGRSDLNAIAELFAWHEAAVAEEAPEAPRDKARSFVPAMLLFDEADTLIQTAYLSAPTEAAVFATISNGILAASYVQAMAVAAQAEELQDGHAAAAQAAAATAAPLLLGVDDGEDGDDVHDAADADRELVRFEQSTNARSVRSLLEWVAVSIFITATPAAIILTGSSSDYLAGGSGAKHSADKPRYDVVVMPIKTRQHSDLPYYGYTKLILDLTCRIVHEETPEGVLDEGRSEYNVAQKFPGIEAMVKHMSQGIPSCENARAEAADAPQRVGLIHCEHVVKRHASIQDYLCCHGTYSSLPPLIVITHNGGSEDSSAGCTLRLSETFEQSKAAFILDMFKLPSTEAEAASHAVIPWAIVKERLANVRSAPGVVVDVRKRLVTFHANFIIRDILSMVARVLERIAPDRALVLIISGMMGNRGTVFKSADKKLHLTDMFLHISETASQQYTLQMAGRLCGRYNDDPTLRLFCTKRCYMELMRMQDIEDAIVKIAVEAIRRRASPTQAFFEHVWPPGFMDDVLRLAKANVDREFYVVRQSKTEGGVTVARKSPPIGAGARAARDKGAVPPPVPGVVGATDGAMPSPSGLRARNAREAIEAAGGDRITRAKKKAVAFNVKVDAEHKRTSIGAALAPLAPPVATDVPASPPAAAAATIAPPAAPTAATDVPASPPAPAAASIARAPEAAPVADGTAVCAARTAEADPLRAVAAESATAGELDRALFARHKPFRPFK